MVTLHFCLYVYRIEFVTWLKLSYLPFAVLEKKQFFHVMAIYSIQTTVKAALNSFYMTLHSLLRLVYIYSGKREVKRIVLTQSSTQF